MQDKKTIYPIVWKPLFVSLTIYISAAIIIPLIIMIVIRFVSLRFDFNETFGHMSFFDFLLILACVPFVAMVLSFLIAQYCRIGTITLSERQIEGRNYWGFKKSIPLADITELSPFNNNGLNAIVVHSKYHGDIYVLDKTERLEELLGKLEPYLNRNGCQRETA